MSSERPWYKRYGSDFIAGTLGLSLEEKGAYSLILDLLYDRGRPLPDDPRYIAGVCGCSVRKWNAIRDRLIEAGKITVRDGTISNPRFDKEAETAAKISRERAENGAKGGIKSGETRAATSKNNDISEAKPPYVRDSRGQRLEEKEKDSEATASGASAPPAAPMTVAEQVWKTVVPWLKEHGGKSDGQARKIIGGWCRDYGEPAVLGAFMEAARSPPVDPVAWFNRRLAGRKQSGAPIMDAFDELDERIRDAGLAAH